MCLKMWPKKFLSLRTALLDEGMDEGIRRFSNSEIKTHGTAQEREKRRACSNQWPSSKSWCLPSLAGDPRIGGIAMAKSI